VTAWLRPGARRLSEFAPIVGARFGLSAPDAWGLSVSGSTITRIETREVSVSTPFSEAAGLPVNEAQPIVAFSPVVFRQQVRA
jgi:hypothetical protein